MTTFEIIAIVLEIIMIACFGASWPFNVRKAYKARTAKGKSLLFLLFIIVGYIAGITSKILGFAEGNTETIKIVAFCFYILNIIMVSADLLVYIRNKKLDAEREKETV